MRSTLLVATACFSVMSCGSAAFAADSGELGDLAAQIQFGYYGGDARALAREVQAIAKLQVEDSLQRTLQYQLAYGQWKLAETLLATDRSGAKRAANNCIDTADKGLEAVPKRANIIRPDVMHAELYAIQAACAAVREEFYKAGKAIDSARGLQPTNPRVQLVDAIIAIARAKSAQDRSGAERMIVATVAAFDAQTPLPANVPDWGHAEALARLGALQLQQGNRIEARNSIERALVLASDYVWAREMLGKITGGR